jgi:hypothetical protein
MTAISRALAKALVSLLHPKMLFLMVWPLLIALAFWTALGVLFWTQAISWLAEEIGATPGLDWMVTLWPLSLLGAHHLAWLALLLLFIPAVLVSAVLIIGLFAMPAMVNHVESRDYAGLARHNGSGLAGALWNSVAALLLLTLLALASLPLWLLPPLWPVLPVLLFAYFNQRVFSYDALAEHASQAELGLVIRRNRGQLFVLGILLSLASHIPFLGFFTPVYAGLVFIHFCLDRLEDLRSGPIDGVAAPA